MPNRKKTADPAALRRRASECRENARGSRNRKFWLAAAKNLEAMADVAEAVARLKKKDNHDA